MRNSDVSQLPVLDSDEIVGTITEDEILRHCTENKGGFSSLVNVAMSSDLHQIDCNSSISDLSSLIDKSNFAIVMENNTFIGIITKVDLLAYLKKNI
jgi:cystathionine beta-synthase